MLSVFIPALNEETTLRESVLRVHAFLHDRGITHEVIVVSNGSTDRTTEIGRALADEMAWFAFYEIPEPGVGRAFRLAVERAKYDFVAAIDADLPSELAFLEHAVHLLPHCDLLIGSKSLGRQHRPLLRVFGSQVYISLAQTLLRLTVSDYSPDSKAIKKRALMDVLPFIDPWTGYILELSVACRHRSLRVIQVSIDCSDTRESRFSMLHEAVYRYSHLFRVWRLQRDSRSWFHRP